MQTQLGKYASRGTFFFVKRLAVATLAYGIIAGLAVSTQYYLFQNKLISIRADAQLGLLDISDKMDRTISNIREQLQLLSRNPSIIAAEKNPQECAEKLQLVQAAERSIENISIADAKLNIICSAIPFVQPALDMEDPNIVLAQTAHDFQIGYTMDGLKRGSKTLPIGTILYNPDGTVATYLYATLDLDWITDTYLLNTPNHNVLITLLDAHGTVIGRSINHAEWIGKDVSQTDAYKNVILQKRSDPVTDLDGTERIFFSSKVGSDQEGFITVVFGIDASAMQAAYTSQRRYLIDILAALYAILLFAIWREGKKVLTEMQWRIVAEAAPIHIVFTDPNGNILFANPEAQKITGYSAQEMRGQTPRLWGRQMPKAFYKRFWDTIKNKKLAFQGEITNRRKNGQTYLAEAQVVPVLSKKNEVLGFVGIERDITKERSAAEQLREHDAIQSTFLQVLMHRLRTPLGVSRWNIENVLSGDLGPLNTKQFESISTAHQACNETNTRLGDMLNALAVKSGSLVVNHRQVDLAIICNRISKKYSDRFKNKKIQATFKVQTSQTTLVGDEMLLERAMSHLVHNASEYTKPNGKVEIRLTKKTSSLIFTVKDNGIGIPEAEQRRIFQLFFRASNASVMHTEGYGIGLFLAKAYVEAHNGKITMKSTENKGSTFELILPIS